MVELLHGDVTESVIGAAFEVQKELGYGFLEKVYERAMVLELQERGQQVEQQVPVNVVYKGKRIGHSVADLVVDGKVLVELKTGKELLLRFEAQMLNYLKATGIKVGLLINFGPEKCEFKRMVM